MKQSGNEKIYTLEYLPIAQQDMADITRYISHILCNPSSAEKLAVALVEAAEGLAMFPYANAAYTPIRTVMHEYRKMLIQNYIMLYWIKEKEKIVTIALVIYSRRDYEKLL